MSIATSHKTYMARPALEVTDTIGATCAKPVTAGAVFFAPLIVLESNFWVVELRAGAAALALPSAERLRGRAGGVGGAARQADQAA
jgi:hypothetical protein